MNHSTAKARSETRAVPVAVLTVGLKVVTAAWGILVARYLGVAEYGTFAYVLAVIAATQIVSDAGISAYISRYVARKNGDASWGRTFRTLVSLQTTLAVAAGIAIGLVAYFAVQANWVFAAGVAWVVVASAMSQVVRGVLRGKDRADLEVGLQFGGYLTLLTITIVLRDGLTVTGATWLYSLWTLPVLLMGLIMEPVKGYAGLPARKPSSVLRGVLTAFRATLPMNLLGSVGAIWTRLDVLILGVLSTAVAVGNYSAALQIYFGALSLAPPTAIALLPVLVRHRRNRAQFRSLLKKWTLVFVTCGLVCSAAIIIASRWIPDVFGDSYAGAIGLSRILALGLPVAFGSALLSQGFIAASREGKLLRILAVVTVVGGIGHAIGAWALGPAGVAISLVSAVTLRFTIEAMSTFRGGAARKRIGVPNE